MVNPYESPSSFPSVSADRHVNLTRGLAWAIPFGVCGFCIPYIVLEVVLFLRIAFTDMLPFDRAADIKELPREGVAAAVVCSLLFAWSAFANYSARRGVGFVRSLLVMASFFLVAVCFWRLGVAIFDLERGHTYTSSGPYEWVGYVFLVVIFLAGAVGFTFWQIRRSEVKR
jgi:hypothetical protein